MLNEILNNLHLKFSGDLPTIERIAYELAEDQAAQNVIYFEVRYSPHFLSNTIAHFFVNEPVPTDSVLAVTPDDTIGAVVRGLRRGEKDFGIKSRIILCSITGLVGWCSEVVQMAQRWSSQGVVAIDIAGDESSYTAEEVSAFERAKQLGIHRTVHSGEMGPPSNVEYAVKRLFAERIGHGYHVIQDRSIYDMCRKMDIHFETCPYSSYLTGSVPKHLKQHHPIVTFALDNVNFSINKDDPTQTASTLDKEYHLLQRMGLNELHFVRAVKSKCSTIVLPARIREESVARPPLPIVWFRSGEQKQKQQQQQQQEPTINETTDYLKGDPIA
ncbi:hypothetical protein RDWZM_003277 [Blomia tropicalis]|uniref:adenosine deaminase n=1 Tax=Blomia tropicalis TaxID=40697 RepID=A0A9Q0MHS4_BLOTA|nr:hypothetical protein RDWZM_003277 [Blomia tropicalis]